MYRFCSAVAIFLASMQVSGSACAQQVVPATAPVVVGKDGKPVTVQPGSTAPPASARKKPPSPAPGKPSPSGNTKAGKPEKPKEQKSADTPAIRREAKPDTPPDPEELKATPDQQGLVRFSFSGQPWEEVINWIGRISDLPIDWTELPGDYLNLATPAGSPGMTVEQVRDLINSRLLVRGYTLLEEVGLLSVQKTEGINTALVPRVRPEDLANLMPHAYVKVSFKLDWVLAEEMSKEWASMVSAKTGKLTPLASSNRLEAMDAVKNLRQLYDLIQAEQSKDRHDALVQEFELTYARASVVKEKLGEFLGLEAKPSNQVMTPQQLQAQQRMLQMQMQQAQKQGKAPPAAKKEPPKVSVIVNELKNSVIIQAPPDKMVKIVEVIRLLDVETNRGMSLEAYVGRIKTYRLAELDPQEVVNILQETGGLDPTTKMRVDESNRAIILNGPPWDHMTMQKLIEKLDGSARQLKVIPLRKLPAIQVAGTLKALMVGPEKDDSSRRSYYYDYYSYRSRGQQNASNDSFRVDADVQKNRLLLWCNTQELERVHEFLMELGEIPNPRGAGANVRVISSIPADMSDEFLRKLQAAFENIAPNPVELPRPLPKQKQSEDKPIDPPAIPLKTLDRDVSLPAKRPDQIADRSSSSVIHTIQFGDREPDAIRANRLAPNESTVAAAATAPPVRISRNARGELVITSRDARALDLIEQLIDEMKPQPKPYHVFTLKYAYCGWVVLKLEDFFDEGGKDDDNDRFNSWWFGYPMESSQQDESPGLASLKPIKFITEMDTNTILVLHATQQQLQTIQDLIELYDVPEPVNTQAARVTKLFHIKYSKPSIISATIKDAYRDLLSDNDKALQEQKQKNDRPSESRTYVTNYGFSDEEEAPERPKISFKGKLSIGVDDLSKSMVVSTEGELLMNIIGDMIESLDKAAMPVGSVEVVKLNESLNGEEIRNILSKLLSEPQQPEKPQQPQPNQPPSVQLNLNGRQVPQQTNTATAK